MWRCTLDQTSEGIYIPQALLDVIGFFPLITCLVGPGQFLENGWDFFRMFLC